MVNFLIFEKRLIAFNQFYFLENFTLYFLKLLVYLIAKSSLSTVLSRVVYLLLRVLFKGNCFFSFLLVLSEKNVLLILIVII